MTIGVSYVGHRSLYKLKVIPLPGRRSTGKANRLHVATGCYVEVAKASFQGDRALTAYLLLLSAHMVRVKRWSQQCCGGWARQL